MPTTTRIAVTSGPNKADLLRAVANPDEHLHAIFGTPVGAIEAHIDSVEEIGLDGVDFTVWGHLADCRVGRVSHIHRPGAIDRHT